MKMRPIPFIPAVTEISAGEAGGIKDLEAVISYWTEGACSAKEWFDEVLTSWGPAGFVMRRGEEDLGFAVYGPQGYLPHGGGNEGSQAPRVRRGRSGRQRPRPATSRPDAVSYGERLEAGAPGPTRGLPLHLDARGLREHRRGRGAGPRARGTGAAAGPPGAGTRRTDVRPGFRRVQGAKMAVLTAEAPSGDVALISSTPRACPSAG